MCVYIRRILTDWCLLQSVGITSGFPNNFSNWNAPCRWMYKNVTTTKKQKIYKKNCNKKNFTIMKKKIKCSFVLQKGNVLCFSNKSTTIIGHRSLLIFINNIFIVSQEFKCLCHLFSLVFIYYILFVLLSSFY